MSKGTITAVEIQETEYGEKVVLDSPFESKEYVKFLPWGDGDEPNYDELEADTDTPSFEFSDGYASHTKALFDDGDFEGWAVDVDSWEETREFFESVGFTVEIGDDVPDGVL